MLIRADLDAGDLKLAQEVLAHCQAISVYSDDSRNITRTFLTEAARSVHAYLTHWMEKLGMHVRVDAAGNLRGIYGGASCTPRRVLIGSHLDTVPNAGRYDGVLGVVLGISLVQLLAGERLPFDIEVIGFSEEEGVRFGVPFIGSRALIGDLDEEALRAMDSSGVSIDKAMRDFGLDPKRLNEAILTPSARAYLEFHVEQGAVLDSIDAPLGIVEAVTGRVCGHGQFHGEANHAGTTPMHLRRDALCSAAEWITSIEKIARATQGLVATVGMIDAKPGVSNVIPGEVIASIDVRHAVDSVRRQALRTFLQYGKEIAGKRATTFELNVLLDQPAVPLNQELMHMVEAAIQAAGLTAHRMTSGAGHDAVIVARRLPCAMVLLRNPGGISHHPDETVKADDVALALRAGVHFLRSLFPCPLLA